MEVNKNLLFITTILTLVPIIGFLILLVVWFSKKNALEGEAKDYLKNLTNFEVLLFIITFVLGFVLAQVAALVGLFNLVIVILAAISVFNGKNYKFPFNLELLK